jgi:hypothetical protein
MSHTRAAVIASGVVLAAIVALSAVTAERPTQLEKDRAAVEQAADRLTHPQIADAWTQTKLGHPEPLADIKRTFPLPTRTIYEDGPGIVLVFTGHNQTCVDFVSRPQASIVRSRRC